MPKRKNQALIDSDSSGSASESGSDLDNVNDITLHKNLILYIFCFTHIVNSIDQIKFNSNIYYLKIPSVPLRHIMKRIYKQNLLYITC